MRSEDLRRTTLRLRALSAVLLIAFAVLAVRAGMLATDPRALRRAKQQTDTVLRIAPARGLVTDRAGAELAVTVPSPSVYAVPDAIQDPVATTRALASALGTKSGPVAERLSRSGPFVFVRRWISDEQARAIEALALPGIGVVREPRRVYPNGALAGRVIGFANIDAEGVRGIEQLYDDWLRGSAQRIAVERDARGNLLANGGLDPRSAFGGDVALTLDAVLQADAEAALAEIVGVTGARGGLVVVLDPATGDLLAVAENPSFDPNDFRRVPFAASRARAFLDAMEPGSSLKPVVVAGALEAGRVGVHEGVDCEGGSWHVPGKTLRDQKKKDVLDPAGILRYSSNIGAAKLGYRIGAENHHEFLKQLGFGRPTGSGFPDESSGLLRDWRQWQPIDHATISFGQGIGVTAVQLAAAVGAIAADGIWRTPRLVQARRAPGGSWRSEPALPSHRAMRAEVAVELRHMLEGVVSKDGGTGSYASLSDVAVAGKTGTAQKLDPDTGRYSQSRYLAWFVGMAPADKPTHVVIAMVDEARGTLNSGGAVAAPLFARVAASALAREGVVTHPAKEMLALARIDHGAPRRAASPRPGPAVPSRTTAHAVRHVAAVASGPIAVSAAKRPGPPDVGAGPLPQLHRLGDRVLLPDFTGYTSEQVSRFSAGLPYRLVLSGRGRAIAQEPPPGSIVANEPVRVRFARAEGR